MMHTSTALLVDDEPSILKLLTITLNQMNIRCECAGTVQEALAHLEKQNFNLCLTDMRLPDGNGMQLIEHVRKHHPELPIAVITAHGNMETAIEALKAGAFDFVSKPVNHTTLRTLVVSALNIENTLQELPVHLLGNAPCIQQVRKLIHKYSRSQAPVHIHGRSGTGKELIARLIHELGPRRHGPFIAVNCGAIPTELMESEFFGHIKGSFSGATHNKIGLFQAAHHGILFLDEVADLPLHMQVKLLRAIQEKSVRPIGAAEEQPLDVRILSATHKNLTELVASGHFRQDLYYRLNVLELMAPSLNEHPEDIPLLAQDIILRATIENEIPPILSADAIALLQNYAFPGNVRELENCLERALTLHENGIIQAKDLQISQDLCPAITPNLAHPQESLDDFLSRMEREKIISALEAQQGNKSAAAKALGISFRTLRYRLEKLGLS